MWNQYNRNTFQRQGWTAFFSFTIILHSLPLTTDKADGIDCVCVGFLCLSETLVCLKHLSYENLRWNDSRRQYDERPTADACRLSQGFRAKELPADPTRRVNMSVSCAEVFIVNWRADLRKYIKLSYCRGTARCVVSVEILPIAKQQCRKYLYDKSW